MVGDIFALYVRIQKEAAAAGDDGPAAERSRESLDALARLVGQVRHHRGRLGRGHFRPGRRSNRPTTWPPRCGPGTRRAPRPATWPSGAQHVEQFRSPKAYALVVDALLDHRDPVAAMALLVQWLSQAEEIPLVEEDYSFHDLALDWMEDLWERRSDRRPATAGRPATAAARSSAGRWRGSSSTTWKPTPRSIGKCRASSWPPRRSEPTSRPRKTPEAEDEDDLFGAAYEDVTYRDSTDDGVEGEMLEGRRRTPPTSSWWARPSGSSAG